MSAYYYLVPEGHEEDEEPLQVSFDEALDADLVFRGIASIAARTPRLRLVSDEPIMTVAYNGITADAAQTLLGHAIIAVGTYPRRHAVTPM